MLWYWPGAPGAFAFDPAQRELLRVDRDGGFFYGLPVGVSLLAEALSAANADARSNGDADHEDETRDGDASDSRVVDFVALSEKPVLGTCLHLGHEHHEISHSSEPTSAVADASESTSLAGQKYVSISVTFAHSCSPSRVTVF